MKRYRLLHFRKKVDESYYEKLGKAFIAGKEFGIYKGCNTERLFLKDVSKPKNKGWSQLIKA